MTYVATPKDITVLGQIFQSFATETGEVVFSQSSSSVGLDIAETSVRRFLSENSPKALQGKVSGVRHFLKAKVGESVQKISVVSMADLTAIVSYLADKGHDRAVAMQQASFALMLQQSVDVAYNVTRESKEYTDKASHLALLLEKTRKELREISGRVTNPTLACNLYTANNTLVYGEGKTRDNYSEEDAAILHSRLKTLESIQAGMKVAGMDIESIKIASHHMYNLRLKP